jgi:hypothetical protein
LMHQMRISTNKVSSVVLGPEKVGSPKKNESPLGGNKEGMN